MNVENYLRSKYKAPEWLLFSEVRNTTGYAGTVRSIDYAVYNMYPSKKYWRIAFEEKASRADFARELEDPSKRSDAEKYYNERYFVITDSKVCSVSELPSGWGLIAPHGDSYKVVHKSAQTDVADMPWSMVASILRRAADAQSGVMHEDRVISQSAFDNLVHKQVTTLVEKERAALSSRVLECQRSELAVADKWRVLRTLVLAANNQKYGSRPEKDDVPSTAHAMQELLDRAAAHKVTRYLTELADAHKTLGKLIDTANQELSGES